jgi:hypothetical protein
MSTSEILDQVPPSAPQCERALLATALQDHAVIDVTDLKPADFYDHRNVAIWAAMKDGARSPPLLIQRLGDDWEPGYIAEINNIGGIVIDAPRYAAEIRNAASKRRLRELCIQGLQATSNGKSAAGILDWFRSEVERQAEGTARVEYRQLTCAELDRNTYDLEYLVEGVLVARQPCIIAGGKKCLKTSILIDLGVSLAMGGHFLGYAAVNRACRVGIMTGESGLATIQETARRIAHKAGYLLGNIGGLIFSEDLPQFGSREHEDAFRRFIVGNELEVVCVDPAYLSMPGGDAGNLFTQGELLRGMTKVCVDTGCTLILAHHTRKTKVDPFAPPELEDIAWAGFQEFARQWLLVGRRELYQPGTGEHRLWLSVGGSAGHTALWALDIDEGTRDTPGGRYWDCRVMRADEARQDIQARQEQAKQSKQQEKVEADGKRIVDTLAKFKDGETPKTIRERAGLNPSRFNVALAAMIDAGQIVPTTILKPNRKTPYDAFKLAEG